MKQLLPEAKRGNLPKLIRIFLIMLALVAVLGGLFAVGVSATGITIDVQSGDTNGNIGALEVIVIFAFLALLPSIVLMMTSFTRIIIVLGFLRNAMGTQQSPPNMILIGIAIFLTLFIMAPTLDRMNEEAYQPYLDGKLDSTGAIEAASVPLKEFMLTQTDVKSLDLFMSLSDVEAIDSAAGDYQEQLMKLPMTVVIPSFMTSEITKAFMMGFFIYLPFLIIDIVVSSILMSMGMVMLPPAMISSPFKLLMFVLVDGWNLMVETLVQSFSF